MSDPLRWLGTSVALLAALAAVSVPLVILDERRRRRKLEEAFAGRAPLDAQTFYEKYFRERGVPAFIVIQVRDILEEVFDADLRRISAADDFSANLNFLFQEDSMADVELVERLEEEFHIKISDAEVGRTRTVEDMVYLVWSKLSGPDVGGRRNPNA